MFPAWSDNSARAIDPVASGRLPADLPFLPRSIPSNQEFVTLCAMRRKGLYSIREPP